MTPKRQRCVVYALVVVQATDALFNTVAKAWVSEDLEHLRLPQGLRFAFPIIKASSAVGLLAGIRYPRLGRLTVRMLVVYFLLAVAAHLRVRDAPKRHVAAVVMLVWSSLAWRSIGAVATKNDR